MLLVRGTGRGESGRTGTGTGTGNTFLEPVLNLQISRLIVNIDLCKIGTILSKVCRKISATSQAVKIEVIREGEAPKQRNADAVPLPLS